MHRVSELRNEVSLLLRGAAMGEDVLRDVYDFEPTALERDYQGGRFLLATWANKHGLPADHVEQAARFYLGQCLPTLHLGQRLLKTIGGAEPLEILGMLTAAAAPNGVQANLCRITARFLPMGVNRRERAQSLAAWRRGTESIVEPPRGADALRQELLRWVRAREVEDVVGLAVLMRHDLCLNYLEILSDEEDWVVRQVLAASPPRCGWNKKELHLRISAAKQGGARDKTAGLRR